MKKIRMKAGRYRLVRERDGEGYSGHMLISIDPKTGDVVGKNGEVYIGCCIRCGTFYAGTFTDRDWWMTTPVTKILEQDKDNSKIKFKTGNSIYTLTSS